MYTIVTVAFYTVNGRTLQQRIVRYSGNSEEIFNRFVALCSPVNSTLELSTDNGKTTATITSKE